MPRIAVLRPSCEAKTKNRGAAWWPSSTDQRCDATRICQAITFIANRNVFLVRSERYEYKTSIFNDMQFSSSSTLAVPVDNFWRVRRLAKSRLLASLCQLVRLSVRPHGTTRLPLDGF